MTDKIKTKSIKKDTNISNLENEHNDEEVTDKERQVRRESYL